MTPRDTIQTVINTLNLVTVSGKQNMDRLLGSIMALEGVVKQMDAEAVKAAEKIEIVKEAPEA